MKRLIYIALLGSFFAVSCASDSQADDQQNVSTEQEDYPEARKRLQNNNPKATPIARPNPEERNAWSILTVDLWHYNFALSVTDTPDENIYEGYWIDFEDDFSYTKGYYNDVVATGYYDYDNDSKILEIIPEEGDDEPSQWTIKTNGEVIILIGTSKYGNNATQIKLVRERERPRE